MASTDTFLSVKRLNFQEVDKKKYRHYKNNLEPFILVSWEDAFPNLKNFSENTAEILCSYVDSVPTECSAVHNEDVSKTLYFYQKDYGTHSALKQSTNGGMDILDDPVQLERELLELHVSAIKGTAGAPPSQMNQHSRLDDIFGYGRNSDRDFSVKPTCCLKLLPLPLKEAREILLQRAQVKTAPALDLSQWEALLHDEGALSMKALISSSDDLMNTLNLENFFFTESNSRGGSNITYIPLSHPLLLAVHSYAAWICMSEKGSGTRTHTNIMSSHGYVILLKGRKRWRMVHPLDRHLVVNLNDGTLPDLFNIDRKRFPLACYARIYEFTQEAGEAVFVPNDALITDISLEATTAVHIAFMDNSCAATYEKQKRDHSIIIRKSNLESETQLSPLTTVDMILFTENVYSTIDGKSHLTNKEKKQDVYLLRSLTCFEQIEYPCSDLGARIELEALQNCFSLLGDVLLQPEIGHYAVGIPKGFIVSKGDRRLLLYYNVKHETMSIIKDALSQYKRKLRNFIHWYECVEVTLPALTPFRFTCSQFGKVPNYIPLSVLLGQTWPFEHGLLRNGTISLGRVILDKVHHPLGFICPGSVWHYSRFFTFGEDYCFSYAGNGNESISEDPTFKLSFLSGNLEENVDKGWCRTFLFYCCPLLEKPILMHPIIEDATLQKGEELIKVSVTSTQPEEGHKYSEQRLEFGPRILEFRWDVDMLEKYGMGSLIHMGEKNETLSTLQKAVVSDPCFDNFLKFVAQHDMQCSDNLEETEVLMTPLLYFLCRPCVVGYTCGSALQRETKEYDNYLTPLEQVKPVPSTIQIEPKVDIEAATWDTVCLTTTAASALLNYEHDSVVSAMVTRLCNWVCDIQMDPGVSNEEETKELQKFIMDTCASGTVEEKAAVTEVLRVKQLKVSNASRASSPLGLNSCEDAALLSHRVNKEKLKLLQEFCETLKNY